MDPFTQRMLERARARQEKIDQKLANSGQAVAKRKPLSENIVTDSPLKTPFKNRNDLILSPKKTVKDTLKVPSPAKSPTTRSSARIEQKLSSPAKRNDFVVTKKEFKTPKRSSSGRRNSDVSVEINIMHRDDIQIEVQVEERDAPLSVTYEGTDSEPACEVREDKRTTDRVNHELESRSDRGGLRHNIKSRLDRLGVLYSDKPDLSSPIHRTEAEFTSETPPSAMEPHKDTPRPIPKDGKRKFGRLAALADQINNWEDDLSHHGAVKEEPSKTGVKSAAFKSEKADSSTLDVSIHSLNDINKVLQKSVKKDTKTPVNTRTFTKLTESQQKLHKNIVAELEGEGYRRVSAGQSRLVYDFSVTKPADPARQAPSAATPSAAAAPNMATMVVSTPPVNPPTVAKKPSIKKYKAPTPPKNVVTNDDNSDSDKDKENNVVPHEENDNGVSDCIQTTGEPAEGKAPEKGSPVVKRFGPKLNGNVDRSSVLSKAAMFESGSPKARDPAEMSLRERKALFEKNKGTAIVPKAPFGFAPSAKTLHNENTVEQKPATQAKSINSRANSKENIQDDNISQSSLGGGIKGKLAALFNKEQTISETTIAGKFRQERDKEMEMLQNRFQFKPKEPKVNDDLSDDEHNDIDDPSEKAPLMGSTLSLSQVNKKPEIISNIPKVTFDKTQSQTTLNEVEEDIVSSQPGKRRSSQDSPVVLSVLEDVKRIKVHNNKEVQTNGAAAQPTLYPHLSDIETDTSHTQEEYSDCGGSSDEEKQTLTSDLNKSDNWAETSFGREVMNVVKKNNSSYKKAVREENSDSDSIDSELDDMLDEALNEEDSEGPTPPKLNKNGNTLSSKSFTYEQGSPMKKQFKSPLKGQLATPKGDRGNELVHSVSFYRRMQNASSQPTTPVRVVRESSPPAPPPPPAATTLRKRVQELQAEISKQQTVISQASQALNLCASTVEFSGSTEQAEGERLLLLATHRRQACVHESQRLQVEGAGPAAAPPTAQLALSNITLALRRDYVRRLNADGALGHHVLCLVKCRDRVLASSMQPTEPSSHLVAFPDHIQMDGLNSDFKVTIEVYLLPASKEILPHDVKYHIFSKKSSKLLTPRGKSAPLKAPPLQSPAGPSAVRAPQFTPHGYCIFALQQANRTNFTLNKVPSGSPLEGSIQMSIKARVHLPPPSPHRAFLTAFDDVRGLGAWHRRYYALHAPLLQYWKYPDDAAKKPPTTDIDLRTVTSEGATRAPRSLCARPHTLTLETQTADGSQPRRHLLAADTAAERDDWLERLNAAIQYVKATGAAD